MDGKITKSFKFGTLIKVDDLSLLDTWIKSKFPYIKYSIKTSNGADYNMESFQEIINYDNPSPRKIIAVYINANLKEKTYSIYDDLSISILDSGIYNESATYTLRNMNQEDIESYSHKLDEYIKHFKSSYSWMNSNATSLTLTLMIWLSFYFFVLLPYYKIAEIKGAAEQIIISNIVGVMMGFLVGKLLVKISTFFFPETIFLIGRQVQFNENKKKLRNIIGVVILLGIITGIVSSLIAASLSK